MDGWIGVDLDGTLAEYHGWKGIAHIGAPIPLMVERVKAWVASGRKVKIFTARVDGGKVALQVERPGDVYDPDAQKVDEIVMHIENWCMAHLGFKLPITNVKDFAMIELWDDRAVRVEFNTGRVFNAIQCDGVWV